MDSNTPGSIAQYNLPLTSASRPNFSFATEGNGVAIAFNANGDVAINSATGSGGPSAVQIFSAPLSGASTPSATFPSGTDGPLVYTQAGDLILPSTRSQIRFTHPFSNTSSASVFKIPSIADGLGAVLDATGNLYIANNAFDSQGNVVGNILVFAPPYSTPSMSTTPVSGVGDYEGEAIGLTQLFVSKLGGIDVYALPITASSQPQSSITTGVNEVLGIAVDLAGNLYVANDTNNSILVYAPPFSTASTPVTTVPTNLHILSGLAIGR